MMTLLLLTASLLAGCSSAPHSTAAGHRVVVTDGSNGTTLTLHKGDTLDVQLHSTYWKIATPRQGHVLTLLDRVVHAEPPSSRRCLAGMGCGTVVATFRAQHTGDVEVVASRTTCGEALRCTSAQSHYELAVDVD